MPDFLSLFGRRDFLDEWDQYIPDHLPEPGPYLDGHDVLTGDDHVAIHTAVRDVFELRGVYDVAYDYNLARLNIDRRYPDAGLRYAIDADDSTHLRVEFTPSTEFCPQAASLAPAAFRALWAEGVKEYDQVTVRIAPAHHIADSINEALEGLEATARESGSLPPPSGASSEDLGEELDDTLPGGDYPTSR